MNIVIIGASSLIAQESARLWAAKGCHFLLFARQKERLQSLAEDLKAQGAASVVVAPYDAHDFRDLKPIGAINNTFKKIDILLIAHGVLGEQKVLEGDLARLEEMFRVNLMSYVYLLNELAPIFEAQKSGTLAVITSVAGDRGRRSNYYYGASKAAVNVLLQGLRARLSASGAHVVTIKPGMVDTPMTKNMKKGLLFARPQLVAKGIVDAIEKRKNVAYVPRPWALIMMIIRLIPESLFKKLKF